jgi:hypothetical protein
MDGLQVREGCCLRLRNRWPPATSLAQSVCTSLCRQPSVLTQAIRRDPYDASCDSSVAPFRRGGGIDPDGSFNTAEC